MAYGLIGQVILATKLLPEIRKGPGSHVCPDLFYEAQHEVDVMDGGQVQAQNLAGFEQVAQVGAAEVLASVAGAARLNWQRIGRILRVAQVHASGVREEPTITRDCLLYTSDAADDLLCVDLGGRRI